MEVYNLASITKRIYDSNLKLFTIKTVRDILRVEKESTLFEIIKRLLKSEVLFKLERGKYVLRGAQINDFVLANFIYSPSYVSFETALNFCGILSQFPYEVLSCTPKKTMQKVIDQRSFAYIHLKKDLFWGYEKKNEFLVALPEKALLDQLYLASKGLRSLNLDEYDLSLIDRRRFRDYLAKYPKTRQFKRIIKRLNKHIKL